MTVVSRTAFQHGVGFGGAPHISTQMGSDDPRAIPARPAIFGTRQGNEPQPQKGSPT